LPLVDAIPQALAAVAKLNENKAVNEANTKAHVIEPVLVALGWNLQDIDTVDREFKVFDGTVLDYSLKLAGAARLYVEAKSVNENLDDKKFVAQTINYANNDGVLWCVLTNGTRWRVYKTNEPVAMEQKLLLEVDFTDEKEPIAEKAQLLKLISRGAVDAGELDSYGERLFTDERVRKALTALAEDASDELLAAIAARLGTPSVPTGAIRRSLARIFDFKLESVARSGAKSRSGEAGPPKPPKTQEYSLDHHLGSKSALIRELFEEMDKYAFTLGADVTRRIRKQYIGYFRGKKSYFTAEFQRRRVIVYLSLDPTYVQPWSDTTMRDASDIGHYGMGDTEYSLRGLDQLAEIRHLIAAAYRSA
jgi:predicted type IV restriction endonuclease/predicted transport protein